MIASSDQSPPVTDSRAEATLSFRNRAEALALIYIAVIAQTASATGAYYILFPELGALSYDVLGRPSGRWASAPIMLAVTPFLTGLVGTLVTRNLAYGFFSVLITVAAAVAIIVALRSPIAPAISAGLLPLVLDVSSWWYPPGILFGSTLLALISLPWKRYASRDKSWEEPPRAEQHQPDPLLPWAIPLTTFVVVAVVAVRLTGLRFILFPPLVVIAYEMFRHPQSCPWSDKLLLLPIACFLCAAGGLFFHDTIPPALVAAAASMACGAVVLRILKLNIPPALAVALLPMVMTRPTIAYPLAVIIGTALAAGWFAAFSRWIAPRLGVFA